MSEDYAADPTPPRDETGGRGDIAAEFFRARLELIQLEAREAGKLAGKKVALVAIICVAIFFGWCLMLAGLIGWISAAWPDWPWHWSALIAAGLHLLLVLLALHLLTRPSPAAFPLTSSELAKDREWLKQLKHTDPPKR